MQRAAMLAGIAIDNGGTGIAHNIGHAMGSLRKIHHGRAVGVAMLAALPWNIEKDDGRYAACAAAMGAKASAAGFAEAYERLLRACGLKVSVAEEFAGVSPEHLARQMARPENASMRATNAARGERRRSLVSRRARARSGVIFRPLTAKAWMRAPVRHDECPGERG